MINRNQQIHSVLRKTLFSLLLSSALMLMGCVKEDLSDCPDSGQGVILKYRYDLNMDYADKFAEKVENLQTFVFDENGTLLDTLTPYVGAGTITPEWEGKLDINPGTYSFVTWAGSNNFYKNFFTSQSNNNTPGIVIGQTKLEDLRIFLSYKPVAEDPDQVAPTTPNFQDLYHGLTQTVTVGKGYTTITTPLKKNTNTIRIKIKGLPNLQTDVKPDDFEFRLTSRNGHYKYDNTINEQSPKLNYSPYQSQLINNELISDIKTLRLMKPTIDPFGNGIMLLDIIYKPSSIEICKNVNLVDLILSGRIPARDSQGNYLTDQSGAQIYVAPSLEYLDRQDLFELTYEISENIYGELVFTVYVNDWEITNIYPDPTL